MPSVIVDGSLNDSDDDPQHRDDARSRITTMFAAPQPAFCFMVAAISASRPIRVRRYRTP